jgi:hypothetical protein
MTRVPGRFALSVLAIAPAPVHRSIAVPPAGDVDAGIDPDLQAAELDPAGDPRERLAGEPAPDERVQELGVAAGADEELFGLLVGRDEPGVGEQCGERLVVVRDQRGGPRRTRSRIASSGPRNQPRASIHQVSPASA